MKLVKLCLMLVFGTLLSGCLGLANFNPGALPDGSNGVHRVEQDGVSIKQLYDAFMKTVEDNPKEYKLLAEDYDVSRAEVYAISYKYNTQVTFIATTYHGESYLSIKLQDDKTPNMQDMYKLENVVILNISKDSNNQ